VAIRFRARIRIVWPGKDARLVISKKPPVNSLWGRFQSFERVKSIKALRKMKLLVRPSLGTRTWDVIGSVGYGSASLGLDPRRAQHRSAMHRIDRRARSGGRLGPARVHGQFHTMVAPMGSRRRRCV
jgi:hypothetical protein